MKTIKDIAHMASTNVQAVYRYINKHNIEPAAFDDKNNHAKLYKDKMANNIADKLAKRKPRIGRSADFQLIKKQLLIQNEQINNLNETIRNLNQTINNLNGQLALEKKNSAEINQEKTKLIEDQAATSAENKTKDDELKRVKNKLDKINNASLWSRITKHW